MGKPNLSILTVTMGSGGAQKVISLLLKKLVLDYNVSLVLYHNQVHFEIPEEVEVIILGNNTSEQRNVFQKFTDFVVCCRRYRKLLKARDIQFSISFLASPNIISGIVSLFNKKCKMIISERGFPTDNVTSKLSFYISKIAYPLFYNRCDSLFSNSVHINSDLKENFGVNIPMDVVYNPIELPSNYRNPETFSKAKESFKLINVGSVDTRKNQDMILRAMANLPHKNISFTLLGDGHLMENLQERAKTLELTDRVAFEGIVKNIGKYLSIHDCFVLSSFTEGFPNALLEGMSYGLPCISTNCKSGPLEMLNENEPVTIAKGKFVEAKYGLLINNDDDIALSAAVQYLYENPKIQMHYSKMSLKRAEEYELGSIYSQFKTFIHSYK
ncbi:glycosyltransferase [Flagellimonas onchidii]|uniref:glycosyltransferase n=1 Tax=Flagellimonas onchidii TaxID=2562684 RepID=UPI0010A5E69B|nr:glycosyltransferase [Allomuricauda onchidii]